VDILSGLLNDNLDFLNIWNLKIILDRWNLNTLDWENLNELLSLCAVSTLFDDIAVVARATAIPGKVLGIN
jgi:hypothetical protein